MRDIQNVIEAEYHIVTEEPPKGSEATRGAAAPSKAKAQATKSASTPKEKPQEGAIEGEGFHIDLTWLSESKKALKANYAARGNKTAWINHCLMLGEELLKQHAYQKRGF